MKRFARFWDIYYNSGNFKRSLKLLWESKSVYKNFYAFALWIYEQTDATHKISLQRQAELLFIYLTQIKLLESKYVAHALIADILKLKGRALPPYLKPFAKEVEVASKFGTSGFNKRQN